MNILSYEQATGRAVQLAQIADDTVADHISSCSANGWHSIVVEEDLDPNDVWIEAGEVRQKSRMSLGVSKLSILADGTDSADISGVPVYTKVWVAGQHYSVDDGSISFSTNLAGTYVITLVNPRYYTESIEVVAS